MDREHHQGMDEDQSNFYGTGAPQGGETHSWDDMDPSNPTGYIRDPHRLITYLIPFPRPTFDNEDSSTIPERFLIYTPPPPPLTKPAEGVKEGKLHKVQRKWQDEVRDAKTSTAKTASWKGIKSKVLKGISWAADKTTSSNLDYLGRVADNQKQEQKQEQKQKQKHEPEDMHAEDGVAEKQEQKHEPEEMHADDGVAEKQEPKHEREDMHAEDGVAEKQEQKHEPEDMHAEDGVAKKQEQKHEPEDMHAEDGVHEEDTTKKTVGVEELVLVYPPTTGLTPEQIKEEFVNSMLRTKSKAQRDAIISTALLPVAFGIDILATIVWPFGGLAEIDGVWAYSTIRGAKTARSVTKRLSSSDSPEQEGKIRMNFVLSEHLETMRAYLVAQCQRQDPKHFPGSYEGAPTEEDVLRAIAWSPTEREQNWEDEQWEVTEVKLDLKNVMKKGAKEWIRWCKAYHKHPEKGAKK